VARPLYQHTRRRTARKNLELGLTLWIAVYYDPFHGAGLIVWQDPSNYLRLERAVGFIKGRPHAYLSN